MKLEKIIDCLPENLRHFLRTNGEFFSENICEIRLRANAPICFTLPQKSLYLGTGGNLSEISNPYLPLLGQDELSECFLSLLKRSFYAHEKEFEQGYISFEGGIRVGIGGDFYKKSASAVTSLNIRIPRSIEGCGDCLLDKTDGGLLIAGPPASGKTTILREVVKELSYGKKCKQKRIALIDTRKELSSGFDLGYNTDVLCVPDKAKGIEMALRTLNPEIIAFDEIGTNSELSGIKECLNAGVTVILTAHAGSLFEIENRPVTREILRCKAVKNIALLSGNLGEIPQFSEVKDVAYS